LNIDRSAHTIVMGYDMDARGIRVFVPKNAGGDTSHYFIDTKVTAGGDQEYIASSAFFNHSYPSTHEAFYAYTRRDYAPTSGLSKLLIGCRDGYVRQWQSTLAQDDGANAITSYVDIGPFPLGPEGFRGVLDEIVVCPAAGSGDIQLSVRVGNSAEEAYNATSKASRRFTRAGLSSAWSVRLAGGWAMVRISGAESNTRWAIEEMKIVRAGLAPRRV